MISCLAIDDEPLALRQLASYIEKIPFLRLVASCHSAKEAMAVLNEESIDAIFVDINMPDLNGLDFVRSLSVPPLVVFTTAYSEYAVEGYKVDAVDYLLKPFGLTDLQRAAGKLQRRYEMMHRTEVSPVDDDDCIFLKTDYKVVRISVANIIYIEGMSEYLRIYLEGEDKPIIALLSMKKMEERLQGRHFMRVHRSYIINLKHIKEMNKSRLTLSNDASMPIGDIYKEKLNEYIAAKFLGR